VSQAASVYTSLLHQMTQTTDTCLWNDSSAVQELSSSIGHGAVGATCNPVIVVEVLKKEAGYWREHVQQLIRSMPTASEHDISWKVVEEMTIRGAELLKPVFDAQGGRNGRLSVQTDPRYYRDTEAILHQAVHFATLAPNIIVKIPVTRAGVAAIEEATFRGISINATVCFSLPQCVAVAEAVERGLTRREREGKDISTMGPVCTIMVGRLDDWLKVYADKHDISVDPGVMEWAGVAVFKNTYRLFRERKYRIRLLSAAFRNHMHWSELIGGNVVISPPWKWQQRFNGSDVPVEPRIDKPVEPGILRSLARFPDFERAYNEGGMTVEEFDDFPPTRRTLRQFISACHDLDAYVRDLMIPSPD
jgi:transaldolase